MQKNDTPIEDTSKGLVLLRDKPLNQLKQIIQGRWKIHYRYGGYSGHDKQEMTDSYFQYLPNDSIYITEFGVPYAATKTNFVRRQTEFGYTAWILDYEFNNAWGLRENWIIDYKHNDTLALVENHPDPFGYHMTKIP